MSDDLLAEPLVIDDGELVIGSGAGISVEIDEEKLTHYRLDR
jgi:L-alanine-DL-glutamate epimerase-like enolase superfamily enzyme